MNKGWGRPNARWGRGEGEIEIGQRILNFLNQFDTVDWWRIEFGITKSSDRVNKWEGFLNSIDLDQADGDKQPLWTADQIGGFPAIVFNGTDEYLATSAFSSPLSQPNTIIFVLKNPTVNGDVICDGIAVNKRHNIEWRDTPKYTLRASTGQDVLTITPTVGWAILVTLYDGASTFLRDNGSQGGVGGSIGNDDLTGFVLGANRAFGSPSNISVTDVIIIDGGLTAVQAAQLETLLNRLRGVY